ncbi:MAG: GNAT family protein [Dehalococcoidia bacterium]
MSGLLLESGLHGERVRLRPLELADAEQLRAWFSNPELLQLMAAAPYQFSLAAEEEFIRSKSTNDWEHGIALAIEVLDAGDEPLLIGTVELRLLSPEARLGELGIAIGDPEYWSRGYGEDVVRTVCRYGFEDLDLHRIGLTTAAYNARAQRCYEKVGFIVEGSMRESRYVCGRYYDMTVMGLLRGEFEAAEQAAETG